MDYGLRRFISDERVTDLELLLFREDWGEKLITAESLRNQLRRVVRDDDEVVGGCEIYLEEVLSTLLESANRGCEIKSMKSVDGKRYDRVGDFISLLAERHGFYEVRMLDYIYFADDRGMEKYGRGHRVVLYRCKNNKIYIKLTHCVPGGHSWLFEIRKDAEVIINQLIVNIDNNEYVMTVDILNNIVRVYDEEGWWDNEVLYTIPNFDGNYSSIAELIRMTK